MIHASSGIHSNNVNNEPTIFRSNTQDSIVAVSSNDQDQSETNAQNLVNQPIQPNDTIETERNTADVSTEQSLTTQEESLAEEHTNSHGRVEEETDISWEMVENGETNLTENVEEWSPNAFENTAESWHSLVSHHITGPHLVSGQRTNMFSHTDDDSTYGLEIRELLSRCFLLSNSFIIFYFNPGHKIDRYMLLIFQGTISNFSCTPGHIFVVR
jgi:hypothetical protein